MSIWNTMGQIAQSAKDRHLYVFVTGRVGFMGYLGWANMGTLCGTRSKRVGISRYSQGKTTYTAEVSIWVPLTLSKIELLSVGYGLITKYVYFLFSTFQDNCT